MFKQTDKVYFHRGPVELIGVVEAVSQGAVTLLGVELGFHSPVRTRITVSESDYLCRMDDETFERLTRDEPAFAIQPDEVHHRSISAGLQDLGALGQMSGPA